MAADSTPTPPNPLPPPAELPPRDGKGRRVQARLALALLEALRDQDRPGEVLDDENVSVTLPRRFGLSDVVRTQIMRYESEARRGLRLPEGEVVDLMRLVRRRPDADNLFRQVGHALVAGERPPALRRILTPRVRTALARRRVQRRLRALFGGAMARSAGPSFQIEAVHDALLRGDPGGGSCALVTGMAEGVLERFGRDGVRVVHAECRGRGEPRCLWRMEEGPAVAVASAPVHPERAPGEFSGDDPS